MKKATVNIIKELVSLLTFTEEIHGCNVVSNGVELTVCNTHGLVDNGTIVIGVTEVKVIDVIGTTKIIIPGTSCPVETEITIPAPNYLHGTIKATSDELTQIKQSSKRSQLVYLYEVLQEKRNRNPTINVGRRVDVIMFFLTAAKGGAELTSEKYDNYIDPMTNLAEDFVTKLEESSIVGDIEDEEYTIIPHTIAGFYDRLGHVKNLFNEEYSGVEFRISLPINKGCESCN